MTLHNLYNTMCVNMDFLQFAIQENDLSMAEHLLRNGADPNYPHTPFQSNDVTHLMNANSVEMVELLLRYNADIHIQDRVGNTALAHAVYKHKGAPISKTLLDNDADPNITTTYKGVVDLVQDDAVRRLLAFHRRKHLTVLWHCRRRRH